MLREIRLLRGSFDISTASIRPPDRPLNQLSPDEREEADATFYVQAAGASGALGAMLAELFSHPVRFLDGLFYAIRLARGSPKQTLLNLAYFAQANVLGRWMRRNGLTHLYTHYSSTVALLAHKTFGVEISISFHGPDEFNDPAGFWIREKMAACKFSRAISQYARSQMMKSSDVEDWGKIHVVYLGIEPEKYTPCEFRRSAAPIEILCVGRLAPVKAQHILLGAMDRLTRAGADVRLHIAGDGTDRARLEQETARLGLRDRVIFHGWTLHEKLDALYRRADIFALPSFAEGVPVVLMEAMAMEIPCVTTRITGTPELIRDGIDGLLVAPSDTEELTAAIQRLVDDPDLRLRLGQAGRLRVLDRFDLRKNTAVLGRAFEDNLS